MSATDRIAIVDCGSSKVPQIARVVSDCGASPFVLPPAALPALLDDLPTAVIISGNPTLIRDTGTGFLADFELLHELTMPILGICFGHQVIGLLHGAAVTTGKEDRELRQLAFVQQQQLFDGISDTDTFQQDHTEEVAVPKQFIHLASSSHCFNEAMMHSERPVYGVQFHPECSGDAGRRLLLNFLSLA